jgi:hypothetical protein
MVIGFLARYILATAVFAAAATTGVNAEEKIASQLLETLIENAHVRIPNDGEGCLSQIRPISIGGEISAMLAWFDEETWRLKLVSDCQSDATGGTRCSLTIAGDDGGDVATAGLVFDRKRDGAIDWTSLHCYQTP